MKMRSPTRPAPTVIARMALSTGLRMRGWLLRVRREMNEPKVRNSQWGHNRPFAHMSREKSYSQLIHSLNRNPENGPVGPDFGHDHSWSSFVTSISAGTG